MRCYLVSAQNTRRYAGTHALAVTARQEISDRLGLRKKDVNLSEEDIPTAKEALLNFINTLCAELDNVVVVP